MLSAVCPTCGSVVEKSQTLAQTEVAELVDHIALQRQEAVLFLALWNAAGRTMTKSSLMDAVEMARQGSSMTEEALRSTVKRLNRSLRGLPVSIAAISGIGYRMHRHDANWDWRHLPLLAANITSPGV